MHKPLLVFLFFFCFCFFFVVVVFILLLLLFVFVFLLLVCVCGCVCVCVCVCVFVFFFGFVFCCFFFFFFFHCIFYIYQFGQSVAVTLVIRTEPARISAIISFILNKLSCSQVHISRHFILNLIYESSFAMHRCFQNCPEQHFQRFLSDLQKLKRIGENVVDSGLLQRTTSYH